MSGRKSVGGTVVSVNLELLSAVHAFEGGESLQRHLRRAGDELQELGSVCLVERAKCSPEPLDLATITKLFNQEPFPSKLNSN